MLNEIVIKYKGIILFTIGSLLIFFALYLALYSRIDLVYERVFSEMEMLINNNGIISNECNCDCDNNENGNNSENDIVIDTDYYDDEDEISNEKPSTINKEYIGYLQIPKISLNYGFVAIDSYYNNVNRNIQIISPSDFPDVVGGNFIIAGHSGNASISYFKNLFLLKIGDVAKVVYNNKTYTYKIVDIYKEKKDGTVVIKRDYSKTTLTLITCSYKDREHQTIYIANLESVK